MQIISTSKCFGGTQSIYSHTSKITQTHMRFGIYLPPVQSNQEKLATLIWLSGLTCTEENFITKAGAQRMAAELGLAIVVPDTSPRGLDLPNENDSYDIGTGAGFYVDATQDPWKQGYKMYSYITCELLKLLFEHFPLDQNRIGISGHSMGGHGALVLGLRNPDIFKSISAFAPICAPTLCPWGEKAFITYLGDDTKKWANYDATLLIDSVGWQGPEILVDQGTDDPYLLEQLKPELLEKACIQAGIPLKLRMQPGYDHSYFFIATFIADHLRYHAKNLV